MRRESDNAALARTFTAVVIVMAALYGAVMGATNLLQVSTLPQWHKFAMIAASAVKVPILFGLALLIVLPPIYVSNALAGGRFSFSRTLVMLLATLAITTTTLASMASVSFFFSLTTSSYDFMKLFHVAVFIYAGMVGWLFLEVTLGNAAREELRSTPGMIVFLWLVLYGLVGVQLGWTLRPFISVPDQPFELFRAKGGSFFETVIRSIGQLLQS
jgi:hypothetical protein